MLAAEIWAEIHFCGRIKLGANYELNKLLISHLARNYSSSITAFRFFQLHRASIISNIGNPDEHLKHIT